MTQVGNGNKKVNPAQAMLVKVAAGQITAYSKLMTDKDLKQLRSGIERIVGLVPELLDDTTSSEDFAVLVSEALHPNIAHD